MITDQSPFTEDARAEERRRILAARGWEHDRQRVQALRELLSEPLQRIFLWSYAQLRNRDRSIQNTRDTLMWMSRHIGEIPEQHPVDTWVFEKVALDGPAQLAIRRSELGPEPSLGLGDEPNERYLESYPTSQKFRSAYQEYREMPHDSALVARSGWAIAEGDLRHFVEGHFSEEGAGPGTSRSPLRHRIRRRRISFARWLQLVLVVAISVWVWQLRQENARLRFELAQTATSVPEVIPARPAENILGIQVTHTSQAWVIGWSPVTGAESYAVSIMTEKMDTLLKRDKLPSARCMIAVGDLSTLPEDGAFLYKIDAIHDGQVIASSGYVAYPPI